VYNGTWVDGGAGIKGFPCSSIHENPSLGLNFPEHSYLLGNAIVYSFDNEICFPNVAGGGKATTSGIPIILGDQFCISYYI